MKKGILLVILLISFNFIFMNCSSENPIEKRIYQSIDKNGQFMLKNIKVESIDEVNKITFKAVHTFTHPMGDREVRITRNYVFTQNLDSIISQEDIKSEMKSKGEWVEF